MLKKRLLSLVCVSWGVMALLMYWIYDFEMTRIYISNVVFILGICFFFPGLFLITGAGQFFQSATFLTKKMFSKPGKIANHLKSYNDFLVYRNADSQSGRLKHTGKMILTIGSLYIAFSMIIA